MLTDCCGELVEVASLRALDGGAHVVLGSAAAARPGLAAGASRRRGIWLGPAPGETPALAFAPLLAWTGAA
eukprot:4430481-Pyramimonas_sp.AAC.1